MIKKDKNINQKITKQRKEELEKQIDEILEKLSDSDLEIIIEDGNFTEEEIEYIKRRVKRKSKGKKFRESLRVDEETLKRLFKVGQKYIEDMQIKEEQKLKEKVKEKQGMNLARRSGGITRGDRQR